MKFLITALFLTLFTFSAFGQNEQAPIAEKSFAYKDWTYKNLEGEGETNLRKFTEGKKFVMVVYWAPWCPNWKHDVAFIQQLHEKYKDKGLTIIGVANYDSVEKMKAHVAQYKLTFPMVYDKTTYGDREKTVHFTQRREAGDLRKWGTPWYIFLDPGKLKKDGEALTEKTMVVNGELVKADAENYIQEKLGLTSAASAKVEECDPATKTLAVSKP